MMVSRQIDVPKTTLQRWWKAQYSLADADEDDDGATTTEDGRAWVLENLGGGVPPLTVLRLADLYAERQNATGESARARLTDSLTRALDAYEKEDHEKKPTGPPTMTEWVDAALSAPEWLVEAVLQCPYALSDPRVIDAVGA